MLGAAEDLYQRGKRRKERESFPIVCCLPELLRNYDGFRHGNIACNEAALFTVLDSLSKDLQSKICILAAEAHRRFDAENVAH